MNDDIRTTSTVNLVHILCETKDQAMINMVAYELAYRLYSPEYSQKTFEELLTEFGYKKEEKPPVKKLKR